jgi:hypothetical protein
VVWAYQQPQPQPQSRDSTSILLHLAPSSCLIE